MPASKTVTWEELRVGLMVVVALLILTFFVFYATTGRPWFASEVHYATYLPDVGGLQRGSPVRLVGFAVGTVDSVGLSEFRNDPTRHAAVRFRVYQQYADDIRTDSVASVTTEGLLGESVLELTRGMKGAPVPDDGVVVGSQRGSVKQIVQNVEQLTAELRALVVDIHRDPKKYLHMKISLF